MRAPPIETAVVATVPPLVLALVVTPALLLVPAVVTIGPFLAHLGVLVAFAVLVTTRIAPGTDTGWFAWRLPSPFLRLLAAGAGAVALVTGAVALVTLASAAALRMAPSAQFLQLLSALDIAWSAAALMLGVRHLLGRGAALAAGVALGAMCVWSIATYLNAVGLASDGGWIVDGAALARYVLPFDVAAAVVAAGALLGGVRRQARSGGSGRTVTEQASPQS